MPLYKGEFNWHGESFVLHRHATTAQRAWFFMTLHISKVVKTSHGQVKYYFGGIKDNYKVKKVLLEKVTPKERQINNSYQIKENFERTLPLAPRKWKRRIPENFIKNGPVKIFTKEEIEAYERGEI